MKRYIHKFNNQEEHDNIYNSENYLEPWIATINDIVTYNKKEQPGPGPDVDDNDYKNIPGSIIYDTGTEFKAISPDKWDNSLGTAVAVVVIPASHTESGKCVGVSTKYMNFNSPTIGSESTSSLNFFNVFNGTNQAKNTYQTILTLKDINGNVVNLTDTSKTYRMFSDKYEGGYENNPSYINIISPYMADGTKNPEYPLISGKELSDTLADLYYDRWPDDEGNSSVKYTETGSTTTNIWDPATTVCKRYNAGNWYLPSITELGYFMASVIKIGNAFGKIYNIWNYDISANLTSNTCVAPLNGTSLSSYRRLALGSSGKIITQNNFQINTQIRAFKEFEINNDEKL